MSEINEWLLVYAVKASLLCSAALLMLYALRQFSAAFRSGAVVASALGVLLLPLVSGVLPPISLSSLFVSGVVESVSLEGLSEIGEMKGLIGHAVEDEVLQSAGVSRELDSVKVVPAWKSWVTCIWLVGMVMTMLVYLVRIVSTQRLCRSSVLMRESNPLMKDVLAASMAVKLNRIPEIRLSQRVLVPLTSGFGRSTIILPVGFGQLSSEARRAVLLHECAHLLRRDGVAQLLIALCRSVHWFNPLLIVLDRLFNAESEKACDDLVIAGGVDSQAYSETILYYCRVASDSSPSTFWGGAASGYYPGSQFDRRFRGRKQTILSRIQRIIDPAASRRSTLGVMLSWLLLSTSAVSATVLSAFVLVPHYEWQYQLSERALPHANDLIASWRMDQVQDRSSGGKYTPDSSGGIGDGLIVGPKLHSEGRVSNALSFDGTDDYIDMGSHFPDLQYPITLTAWVRTEGESDHVNQNVVWVGSGEFSEFIHIGLKFGKPSIESRHGDAIVIYGSEPINDGKWHHIAGVFLSENKRLLYSDGKLVAEDDRPAAKPRLLNLQIGRNGRRDKAASYTRGSVDDVRVYGAALSLIDIRAVMAGDLALVAARQEVSAR